MMIRNSIIFICTVAAAVTENGVTELYSIGMENLQEKPLNSNRTNPPSAVPPSSNLPTSNVFSTVSSAQNSFKEDKGVGLGLPPIVVITTIILPPPTAIGDNYQNSLYNSYLERTNSLLQFAASPLIVPSLLSANNLPSTSTHSTPKGLSPNFPPTSYLPPKLNTPLTSGGQLTSPLSTSNIAFKLPSSQSSADENKKSAPSTLTSGMKTVKNEGSACYKDETAGVCIEITKCCSAMRDIMTGKIPQICSFKSSTEAVVCCVDGTTSSAVLGTTSFSTASPSSIPTNLNSEVRGPLSSIIPPNKTGQKAWKKCLEYQEKLLNSCLKSASLFGGTKNVSHSHELISEKRPAKDVAARNEFPHIALLGYGDDVTQLEWQCGGSLISEKFILTAGHCLSSIQKGPPTYVVLGVLKRSDSANTRNRYKIKTIIKHPDYHPPKKYNDIALLELEEEVTLNEFLIPACLQTEEDMEDERAFASGWGSVAFRGPLSDDLKKVVLRKFSTAECSTRYRPSRLMSNGIDPNTQICYEQVASSKDTCQGDGGGSLQVQNKNIPCMYPVVGVTSSGSVCSDTGQPAIYTRVAHYLDWIESIVWP